MLLMLMLHVLLLGDAVACVVGGRWRLKVGSCRWLVLHRARLGLTRRLEVARLTAAKVGRRRRWRGQIAAAAAAAAAASVSAFAMSGGRLQAVEQVAAAGRVGRGTRVVVDVRSIAVVVVAARVRVGVELHLLVVRLECLMRGAVSCKRDAVQVALVKLCVAAACGSVGGVVLLLLDLDLGSYR